LHWRQRRIPHLSRRRSPSPTGDGRIYAFHLRSGIVYSNGTRVRPEDFRYAIERVFKVGNGYTQSFYTGIVGAKQCERTPRSCSLRRGIVTDDRGETITFRLIAPDPDFLYKLAFPMADAVPASAPTRPQTHPGACGRLVRSALEARSPGIAAEKWRQIDRQLTNDATWLPLYNPRVPVALSERVGNYQYHPFWQLLLDQLWVH
jgi:ABC-type transport system substrate-binding protein